LLLTETGDVLASIPLSLCFKAVDADLLVRHVSAVPAASHSYERLHLEQWVTVGCRHCSHSLSCFTPAG
jgi:hypothetical protein